jgi:hypothetical protein
MLVLLNEEASPTLLLPPLDLFTNGFKIAIRTTSLETLPVLGPFFSAHLSTKS